MRRRGRVSVRRNRIRKQSGSLQRICKAVAEKRRGREPSFKELSERTSEWGPLPRREGRRTIAAPLSIQARASGANLQGQKRSSGKRINLGVRQTQTHLLQNLRDGRKTGLLATGWEREHLRERRKRKWPLSLSTTPKWSRQIFRSPLERGWDSKVISLVCVVKFWRSHCAPSLSGRNSPK